MANDKVQSGNTSTARPRDRRDNGAQRAPLQDRADALTFEEGVSGAPVTPRSSTPNVDPYETSDGTRWRDS